MGRRGALLLPLTLPGTWLPVPCPWASAEAWQAVGNTPSLGELISPRATQTLLAPFLHHEKQTDVLRLN